ncbi:MAG: TrfB-related DNA-binding protein [Rheinheimera sp.]
MKKTLSEQQFLDVISTLDVSEQTRAIAYGVLVEGKPQTDFVKQYQVTKGAVSQAVNRVWMAYQQSATLPAGYEQVTAVLPEYQAFQVKRWALAAKQKLGE